MERTIVGIDIGSSNVRTLVAEVREDESPCIIGVGVVPSRGLRKGVVVNVSEAMATIAASVEGAERTSGYHVERAYVSLSGTHISSINSQGVVAVSRRDEAISIEDVDRVLDAAGAIAIPYNRELIHVIPRYYVVDEQEGVRDPIGMHGFRMELEAHVVTGSATAIQNLVKCVTGAGVEVDEVVLSCLAAGDAVLAANEREMGVVLVDIGGGTTDIAIFIEGTVWHTATLGLGGEYVINDVAIGLRVPTEVAQKVTILHGHARPAQVGEDERFLANSFGEGNNQSVARWKLAEIIEARTEETLDMVLQEIKRSGYDGLLPAGVVLCGGLAQLPGISELGREVLGLPVRIAKPQNLVGLVDRVTGPDWAVAAGLVGWGFMADARRPLPRAGASVGKRFFEWFRALLPG